jgi:pimeloyl-ACP methyl ester carboxylesterase
MLPGWLTAIGFGLAVLAAVNLAFLALAWLEYAAAQRKDPWERSTQVLPAGPGNGRPSIVLVHGFGGTPRDFRALAGLLADRGYRVVVPAVVGMSMGGALSAIAAADHGAARLA